MTNTGFQRHNVGVMFSGFNIDENLYALELLVVNN